jgi:Rrf2 family protein
MARAPERDHWTIQELADRTETPAPFLAKTFQALAKGGVLISTKGRGGGFSFARPVDEIHVIDVVMLIDGPSLLTDCALGFPECGDENPCPFHPHWAKIRAAIMEMLSKESLRHLADQEARSPLDVLG